jgi:hypothetical protein
LIKLDYCLNAVMLSWICYMFRRAHIIIHIHLETDFFYSNPWGGMQVQSLSSHNASFPAGNPRHSGSRCILSKHMYSLAFDVFFVEYLLRSTL